MIELLSNAFIYIFIGATFGIIGSYVHVLRFVSNKTHKMVLIRILQGAFLGHLVGLVVYSSFNDKVFIISLIITAVVGLLIGFFGLFFIQYVERKIEKQEDIHNKEE